jgi:hypothetical protein
MIMIGRERTDARRAMKILSMVVDGRIGNRMPGFAEWAVKAIDDGVDVIAGQGTGMDGGPYYLGSEDVLPMRPLDLAPILLAAKRTGTPFVFSMGGHAGADLHLDSYLDTISKIARDNDVTFRIARISGEVSKDFLIKKIRSGARIERSIDTPRLSKFLTEGDVKSAVRIQSQMGPEPVMRAMEEEGIDGVITGRALDVGIHMATPLRNGIGRSTAAHLGKIIECASMVAEPTGPWESIIAEVEEGSFTVRPTNPEYRCTVRSVSGHSLYERENPFEERNTGGVLDVGQAVYEQVDEKTVRCSGGIWTDVPYTVKVEGAEMIGYQAGSICGIRDPTMIEQIDAVIAMVREAVAETSSTPDFNLTIHLYGRDGTLGSSEPLREAVPHEVGLLLVVTAPTQELANELATTARLRLLMGHYEGRRSTAGNTAVPLQRMAFPLGPAYVFNIWHLLPLEDPCEPFPYEVVELGAKER